MNKENDLSILWIIFGFVFISAIDSILYFITYLIYIAGSELGLSYKIMKVSIPIITLILYLLTTFLVLKRIKVISSSSEIPINIFSKKLIILLAPIAIFLKPITHKLSGLYAEFATPVDHFGISGHLEVYGWMHFGISFSKWLILILLVFIYIKKLKHLPHN